MKFFIASPWRNKDAVQSLSDALTGRGHQVYSFLVSGANLASGMSVIEEFNLFRNALVAWEDSPEITHVFESEMQGIKDSDVVILLEPTGRSSLTEAGIAYGMGKQIVQVGLIEHPEVIYRMCEQRYPTVEAFLVDPDSVARAA
jgi:hypothetical protein